MVTCFYFLNIFTPSNQEQANSVEEVAKETDHLQQQFVGARRRGGICMSNNAEIHCQSSSDSSNGNKETDHLQQQFVGARRRGSICMSNNAEIHCQSSSDSSNGNKETDHLQQQFVGARRRGSICMSNNAEIHCQSSSDSSNGNKETDHLQQQFVGARRRGSICMAQNDATAWKQHARQIPSLSKFCTLLTEAGGFAAGPDGCDSRCGAEQVDYLGGGQHESSWPGYREWRRRNLDACSTQTANSQALVTREQCEHTRTSTFADVPDILLIKMQQAFRLLQAQQVTHFVSY